MDKLYKYNEFFLDKEFESIINDIFRVVEANNYEWDISNEQLPKESRLKEFLSKLPKEKIKEYFIKLLNKIKSLPERTRKILLITYASVFLLFVPASFLLSSYTTDTAGVGKEISIDNKIRSEFIKVIKKAKFEEAQKIVKSAEAGYSSDRGDAGNWIKTVVQTECL